MPAAISQRLRMVLRLLLGRPVPGDRRNSSANSAGRVIPAITPEEVAEARQFFPLEKFFIFGHARSGTTLLTRLVRLHPQVHCNYQAHFFTKLDASRRPLLESLVASEEIGSWLSRRSNRWNRGRDLSPVLLRAAVDFILERDARQAGKGSPGCVVGDKSPNSLLDGQAVQYLVNIYPDARLVFIVRDGRDAVISHRFQAFIDLPQHLSPEDQRLREEFTRSPEPFMNGQRSIFTEKALRQSAEGWAHNVMDTHQTARSLLGSRYHALRYEDMLAQPWQVMSDLWRFLGVETEPGAESPAEPGALAPGTLLAELQQNPDADWQQEKAGEIASALTKGKRGTWQELFTPRDREIFKRAAGESLIAWNYENSLDW